MIIRLILMTILTMQGGKEGMMETDKNTEELYTEAKELLSLVIMMRMMRMRMMMTVTMVMIMKQSSGLAMPALVHPDG